MLLCYSSILRTEEQQRDTWLFVVQVESISPTRSRELNCTTTMTSLTKNKSIENTIEPDYDGQDVEI